MHDTDEFARMPASPSSAEQSCVSEMLDHFDEQREVTYRGERYRVRDNGGVWRYARTGARRRKFDEVWTFGLPDKQKGYLVLSDHVVHRIVASAFHGECPSPGHVVDHIDTNRHNNRPENLRWVTRLENILLNPITRARIEFAYGSLEAFFANPGAHQIGNWDWMRTVTKEEAAQSLARLRQWAAEGKAPTGGALGDWLFKSKRSDAADASQPPPPIDIASLTPGAVQRRWRTPTEFPACPAVANERSLDAYLTRLTPGVVFARNRHGESTIVEAGREPSGALSVICATESGVKDWSHARIYVENGKLYHESGGTFFTLKGAQKAHLTALGIEFDPALYESIDDYA